MPEIPEAHTYGGIVINMDRKVLLVEPTGHFGGYSWTFPKGGMKQGETPQQTALRNVQTKTGYQTEILGILPHLFEGTSSTTAFFIMGPVGKKGKVGNHTSAVRWVSREEAQDLIRLSESEKGRERDLAILAAAYAEIEKMTWRQRPSTCADDWAIKQLPKKRTAIDLDRVYDSDATFRIRKGYFPVAMEQKWFAWFDANVLHLHRSWTGFCIYQVKFAPVEGGLRAIEAQVNRNPKQYTETNDEADRAFVVALMDDLFINSPDEPWVDGFAAAFEIAAQPNYLGSPAVVSAILQQVINSAIAYARRDGGDFNGSWNTVWELSGEISSGENYIRIGGWHTPASLGVALAKAFRFWQEDLFKDDLQYFVSEALMVLFLKVRDFALSSFAAHGDNWKADTDAEIQGLRDWATAVFLGTNDLLYPGKNIDDFIWRSSGGQ